MPEKTIKWYKVSDSINEIDFAGNNIAIVIVNNKKICLGKYNDQLFAFAFTCPHAGGIMAGGYIDALGNVVCPLHRYKYDMKSGRNVSGEGYYLKHWPIETRPDGIYVGMEKGGLFGWLS